MLEPKRLTYRKPQRNRGRFFGTAQKGNQIAFGSIALKAMENGEVTARQIEAARKAMAHEVQRTGKIWIRIFPHTPVTRKAAEVPMGAGKGALDHFACVVRRGTVLFEMDGLPQSAARQALTLAGHKLPVKTKIITRLSPA